MMKTHFIVAQQVADTKNTADITPLFSKGKDVAGTRPNTLISDGAPNFHYQCLIPKPVLEKLGKPTYINLKWNIIK